MAELVRPAWMTDAMYGEWERYYLDAGGTGVAGSEERATKQFRASPNYVNYFPGIKRDDGTIRYDAAPEQTYFKNLNTFRTTVRAAGVDPSFLEGQFVSLIEGDVSPAEFQSRVSQLTNRVLGQSDAIRNWYGQNYGIDMSDAGLIASLMNKDVGADILAERITMAEIGGEAAQRNFDISNQFVNMLEDNGMDRQQAQRLFGSAERMLPMLNALATRHGDPDDEFDIEEFASAQSAIQDPQQLGRIRRLVSQERSTFTGGGELDYVKSRQTGGVAGLAQS